jgi:hypothetical protein
MSSESPEFGAVLAEAKTELDDAETRDLAFLHVERLSLAAHHTLLATLGAHLPRPGGHVYLNADTPQPITVQTALDIRY